MSNFNRVILLGNLTRDPVTSRLPGGSDVCEFGLAVSRKFNTSDGNAHEDVCFVDVAAFGKTGETIMRFFKMGKAILVEGRLRFESWEAKDGTKRSKLSVVAERFEFVGPRGGGEEGDPNDMPF